MAAGIVLLALSLAGLVVARSPYRPVAGTSMGDQAYRLASFRADDREPELFLLFACGPRGMLCHEVSAYAPFDLATGRHVAGAPELRASSSAHTITLRVGDSIIGVYAIGTR